MKRADRASPKARRHGRADQPRSTTRPIPAKLTVPRKSGSGWLFFPTIVVLRSGDNTICRSQIIHMLLLCAFHRARGKTCLAQEYVVLSRVPPPSLARLSSAPLPRAPHAYAQTIWQKINLIAPPSQHHSTEFEARKTAKRMLNRVGIEPTPLS